MDDNKLSQKNSEVISDIKNEVKKHFGVLSFVRGSDYTFLGMYIEIKDSTIKMYG